MSELTEAIKTGDVEGVTAVVDADPSLLGIPENGVTPLLFAIYNAKPDIAQLLIARGAEVSFPEAAAIGDLDRLKQLLAGDASLVRSRSLDGFPAVGLAIFFGHGEVARWLIEQGADVNAAAENGARVAPAHAAAAVCDRATMRMLLERGADPNSRQQGDYTPLHGAASRGDIEMAELLLANEADRQARGSDGLSAADVARKYGRAEFAEWIDAVG